MKKKHNDRKLTSDWQRGYHGNNELQIFAQGLIETAPFKGFASSLKFIYHDSTRAGRRKRSLGPTGGEKNKSCPFAQITSPIRIN